jgi:hypothetical protein
MDSAAQGLSDYWWRTSKTYDRDGQWTTDCMTVSEAFSAIFADRGSWEALKSAILAGARRGRLRTWPSDDPSVRLFQSAEGAVPQGATFDHHECANAGVSTEGPPSRLCAFRAPRVRKRVNGIDIPGMHNLSYLYEPARASGNPEAHLTKRSRKQQNIV